MYRRGFTIVELLIVIVVISVLATITIVAYNGISARSQASAVASELRATIKGFVLYKEATGLGTWPLETDSSWIGTGAVNPTIPQIITYNAAFREFIPKTPQTTGLGAGGQWLFDNEGDVYVDCAVNSNGANIILQSVTNLTVAQLVDAAVDDGNLSCGNMHLSGTSLLYNLTKTP